MDTEDVYSCPCRDNTNSGVHDMQLKAGYVGGGITEAAMAVDTVDRCSIEKISKSQPRSTGQKQSIQYVP